CGAGPGTARFPSRQPRRSAGRFRVLPPAHRHRRGDARQRDRGARLQPRGAGQDRRGDLRLREALLDHDRRVHAGHGRLPQGAAAPGEGPAARGARALALGDGLAPEHRRRPALRGASADPRGPGGRNPRGSGEPGAGDDGGRRGRSGSGVAARDCAVPLTADPLNPRPVPSPELFRVDWWHSLVGQRRLLEHAPREPAAPTWDAERQQLITLTRDGRVRALDAAGEERWSRPTDNHFSAGAGISAKRIYLPGGNGVLEALDPTTGESLWTYDTGEELGTMPVEVDGVVLVASHSNSLFAVDAETGAWKWQYRRELPSGFTIRGVSTPTVRDGVIYVGFADGALSALRLADGVAVWERMLSTSLGPFIDVDTQPIFDHQGVLYAASVKDGIFALDPMTGRTLWHQDVPGVTGLLLRGEVLFATGSDGVRAMV